MNEQKIGNDSEVSCLKGPSPAKKSFLLSTDLARCLFKNERKNAIYLDSISGFCLFTARSMNSPCLF